MLEKRSRTRHSRAEWRVIIDEWVNSSLSAEAFARSRGVKAATLERWRRELKKEPQPVSLVELVARPPERVSTVPGSRPSPDVGMIDVSVGAHSVALPATCSPVRAALVVATLLWAR